MLIKFQTKSQATITMFGDVAVTLIKRKYSVNPSQKNQRLKPRIHADSHG